MCKGALPEAASPSIHQKGALKERRGLHTRQQHAFVHVPVTTAYHAATISASASDREALHLFGAWSEGYFAFLCLPQLVMLAWCSKTWAPGFWDATVATSKTLLSLAASQHRETREADSSAGRTFVRSSGTSLERYAAKCIPFEA